MWWPGTELNRRRQPFQNRGFVDSSKQSGTLDDVNREHILRTLQQTRGVIMGPKGAAARLGIKRTTLYARMRKLGISRSNKTR
jgi:transcriptional regulator of acetoin/glycerol metabolism